MKPKTLILGLSAMVLAGGISLTHAGVIRDTGEQIGKTSKVVASGTADGAGVAADRVASAGKATGGAIKDNAPAVGRGIVQAPGAVAHGTASVSKSIWKKLW